MRPAKASELSEGATALSRFLERPNDVFLSS